MNYFTRERYLAQQNFHEAAMDAADADWKDAVDRYDAYLQIIRPDLPESVRRLLDGFYFHDARVLSMGQRGETFIVSLQLDFPPNELLTVTYTLAGPAELKTETFPGVKDARPPWWIYDEIELIREGDSMHFVHSILFDIGWEARLPFREVDVATASPVFPPPRSRKRAAGPAPIAPSD